MLEKYPYNEEFEAWELRTPIFDEESLVLTQAKDEEEFIRRSVELRERIAWLNDKSQEICDMLSASEFAEADEARIELRPAEIAIVKCYAEMVEGGIALDLVVGIVATGIEKDVMMFVDEFDNIEVLGEYKEEED